MATLALEMDDEAAGGETVIPHKEVTTVLQLVLVDPTLEMKVEIVGKIVGEIVTTEETEATETAGGEIGLVVAVMVEMVNIEHLF